ncbi:hypothetical protein [uncultured Rhodospira sp.]|uniref:hypothetical protein n=1 Tax=uncultured Rhodospira sp. TaxID=1936189 RepID=UPI00261FD0CC|nr:hypothetical protein [uncultured Rhodospira sp.]
MTRAFGLSFLATVLLTACAGDDGAQWTKPGVTPSQASADSRACKRQADDHAMRRAHQPDRVTSGGGYGAGGGGLDPMAQVDRVEAREAYRSYYAACMEARGYAPGR